MVKVPTEKRFLTGAREIAKFLEVDTRAAFRALSAGHVRGAIKQGRLWRLDRLRYERAFDEAAA
jgi:hypothetical protein